MKIFNCLDKTLSLRGKFFIEASAGSGKTFSMEQVFLRLLLDTKPLCLSQILIVTFTKDATKEIAGRIRKTIRSSILYLENPEQASEFEYLQAIKEGDPLKKKIAILNLTHALHSFDEANIYTIHGFCLAMLSTFAFEANIAIGCTEDLDLEYPRTLLKKWLISIPINEVGACQLQSLINFFKDDIARLIKRLLEFVKTRATFIATDGFALQVEAIYSITKKYSVLQIENLRDQLVHFLSTYQTSCNSQRKLHTHYQLQIDGWISLLSDPAPSLVKVNELLSYKPLLFNLVQKPQKKISSSLYVAENIKCWIFEIHQLIDKMLNPNLIMFHIAHKASIFIQQELSHTERMFVDDILDRMLLAIQSESFLDKIRSQFSAIMIDEFQDTDAKQWKIFSEIFLSNNEQLRAIYLVGDPKQSIYSFRNANLDIYFLAEKYIGIDCKYRLDTNYRSSPSLVTSLNRLFDDGRWLFLKEDSNRLSYRPAKVGSATEEILDNRCIGSVHFSLLELEKAKSSKLSIQDKENSHIFPFIYREIKELIEQGACEAREIVILVKDRYLAKRLMDFFDSRSVAYCTKGMNSITSSSSFSLLFKLFSALANLQKTQWIIDFFMHPLLQISLHQLQKKADSDYIEAVHQFFILSEEMKLGRLSDFFAKIVTTPFFGYNLVERISLRGNDHYNEFIQIIELIMVQFPGYNVHPQEIIHFFETIQNKNPEEDPRIRKRASNSLHALSIMTIHASKGLEFSVVFALGLGYRTPVPEKIIQKENIWTDLSKDTEGYEEYLWKCEEEKMRQFYVAATRAKKRLYLPIFIHKEEKLSPIGAAAPMELFLMRMIYPNILGKQIYRSLAQLQCPAIIDWIQSLIQEKQITYEVITQTPMIETPKKFELYRRVETSFSFSFPSIEILSFSKLNTRHKDKNIGLIQYSEKESGGIHALPPGHNTGTILHEILDSIVERGLFAPFQEKCIESVIHEKIRYNHLLPYYDDIRQMVNCVFHVPLFPYTFSLTEVQPIHGLSEMQFVYKLGRGVYMQGIIDLLFMSGNQYFIVDWKSHYLGVDNSSYTKENIEKTMTANNYFLQAKIYTNALKKYLSHIESRPFSQCFGGVIYIFLRGLFSNTNGIYYIPPSQIGAIEEVIYDAN
ncbi:MAG: UvrD-helicase domain-containing protein [Chlamydiales bacterium]